MSVHNHGPSDGPGLACRESFVDGVLRGDCLAPAVPVGVRADRIPTDFERETGAVREVWADSAVPVGVQPEPAEGSDVGTEFVQQVEAYERGDLDDAMAEWAEMRARDEAPAVPVVHPEPGDRPADRERKWSLAMNAALNPARYYLHEQVEPPMALADAEVAAAVAAVRADTAARLRGMAAIAGEVQGPFAQPYLAVPASSLETLAEELSS